MIRTDVIAALILANKPAYAQAVVKLGHISAVVMNTSRNWSAL